MIFNNSLYGNYRQVKFTDVFPNVDEFINGYKAAQIQQRLKNENISTIAALASIG